MHDQEFDIKVFHLNWINHVDDPTDLCAHGSVYVKIAENIIASEKDGDGWTLSAAALHLMRTLERDYNPGDFAGQLIPCCGFFLLADDEGDHVEIYGCPIGFDWTIQHDGSSIRHVAANDHQALIGKQDYQKLILAFADKVQHIYDDSIPKILPEDEFDRKGYQAFWREWQILRNKWT